MFSKRALPRLCEGDRIFVGSKGRYEKGIVIRQETDAIVVVKLDRDGDARELARTLCVLDDAQPTGLHKTRGRFLERP